MRTLTITHAGAFIYEHIHKIHMYNSCSYVPLLGHQMSLI